MWELINLTMAMAINKKTLCYQKLPNTNPPFEAIILESYFNRWLLQYQDLNGNVIIEKVNKGCCSDPHKISSDKLINDKLSSDKIDKIESVSSSARIKLKSPLSK